MFENLVQRWNAAWIRLVDRLPLSDHDLEAELPTTAFGVATTKSQSLKAQPLPVAIDRPAAP